MDSYKTFRKRLKERTLDVCDWIDFRPDPAWWPFLAVPLAALAATVFIDAAAAILLLIAGLLATFALAMIFVVVSGSWILGNALADMTLLQIGRLEEIQQQRRRAVLSV